MSVDTWDFEPAQKWGTDIRRAKMEHKCCACQETIRRGDRYARQYQLYDGRYQYWKRCFRCEVMYRELSDLHAGHEDTEVDAALNCGHSFEDSFDRAPPDELARLAFLTADEAQELEL